jgi:O-antigen ligase
VPYSGSPARKGKASLTDLGPKTRGDIQVQSNRFMVLREIPRQRGIVVVVGGVLVGLVLARFVMVSLPAAIVALSTGIVLILTIFVRSIGHLLLGWFVLTNFIWLILTRFFPYTFYSFMGTGIFWGLLLCVIASWAMDNVLRGRGFTGLQNLPIQVTIFLFLLWGLLSTVTSMNVLESIKIWSHIAIALVASYVFCDFLSRDESNMKKALAFILGLAIFFSMVIVGIAGHSLLSGAEIYKRISAWFMNPNIAGHLLFLIFPLSIAAMDDFNKPLKVVIVTIIFVALFLTFSRTSWLAALVSAAFLLWKSRMKRLVLLAICMALFLIAVLLPVFGPDVYDFFAGERYTGRRELWSAAWRVACDYPLLGVGLGNSPEAMDRYIDTLWLKGAYCHDVYLSNAAEMGFVSVAILITVYGQFLVCARRIEKQLGSAYLRRITQVAQAGFVGMMFHNILENGFFLTGFVGGEFHTILPYVLFSIPFAAKKLDKKMEMDRARILPGEAGLALNTVNFSG